MKTEEKKQCQQDHQYQQDLTKTKIKYANEKLSKPISTKLPMKMNAFTEVQAIQEHCQLFTHLLIGE